MSEAIAADTVTGALITPKPVPASLLDVLRDTARRQGHSERTIAALVNWVTIFVRFHRPRHPRAMQLCDVAQIWSR